MTADPSLAEALVLDLDGHEVPFHSLYQRGPVVLVWLRHYG